MEHSDEHEKEVINELKQGKELAQQLLIHLNVASSTREAREFLVHKILLSYDKLLSILNNSSTNATSSSTPIGGDNQQHTNIPTGAAGLVLSAESPRSFSGSPHSEDSDRDLKDSETKDTSRKRAMPRWTKQVQICPGAGLEGPLDDGFSWRKYGQKDILGAKYPRGYYRCTNRHVQGCLATKQVQRSDNDQTVFEITYRGRHTCGHAPNLTTHDHQTPQAPITSLSTTHDHQQPQQNHQPPHSQETLLTFKTDLKVITDNMATRGHEQQTDNHPLSRGTSTFYFPGSTSNNEAENYSFAHYYNVLDQSNIASPSFVFPSTSASNYNDALGSASNTSSFGGNLTSHNNLQASGSQLIDIISVPTSATTSTSTISVNFPFGQHDFFNSHFTFDNSDFF